MVKVSQAHRSINNVTIHAIHLNTCLASMTSNLLHCALELFT